MGFKEKHLKKGNSPYVIAEIGINHNGRLDLAKRMIDLSLDAGADAVKFQKRNIKYLLDPNIEIQKPTGYLSEDENDLPTESKAFGTWTYPDERLEFNDEIYYELINYSQKKNLDFIVSPWEEKSVDFLVSNNAKVIKIASIDATNYQFMEYVASKKIPTLLSTGMTSYDQMHIIKKIFNEAVCPMMFLHCTSAYPCPLEDKNLSAINIIRDMFSEDVGFSGHGTGFEGTLGAVALGATVIEKHVTLSKKMSGPDQEASLEFEKFKELISLSNNVRIAMGSTVKKLQNSELTLKNVLQKKFITTRDLDSSEKIDPSSIRTVVTDVSDGIDPEEYYNILGLSLKNKLPKNTVITFNDLI